MLRARYVSCSTKQRFITVNTDPSTQPGEHWLLIASKYDTLVLYYSFGRDFRLYFSDVFAKIVKSSRRRCQIVFQYKPSLTLFQAAESQFCGIICIFWHYFALKQNRQFQTRKVFQFQVSHLMSEKTIF